MKLTERCHHDFESGDKSRGRSYFLDDMVALGTLHPAGLIAQVEGSYDSYYRVTIDWSEASNGLLAVDCNCPRSMEGWFCKHVWATLLEMDRLGVAKRVPGHDRLEVVEADEISEEVFERAIKKLNSAGSSVTLSKPAKKSKTSHKRAKKPTIPGWQLALSNHLQRPSLQFGLPEEREDWKSLLTSKRREAWYVLDVTQSGQQQALVIELFQRETKKDGEFGKFKQLRLDESEIPTFNDPVDQELLALLVEFPDEPVDSHGYGSRYNHYQTSTTAAAVPASLYEHLLPRLAETGRFVWQLNSMLPTEEANQLAWDTGAPWQFQLELVPDDKKKKWTLTGYYQRGKQIRPLTEGVMPTPTGLLLMDDKLARLDAQGEIFDWLSMLLQAPTPIQIPYRDRERFLQQLCSAPTLPPLKLPENLAWQEVHEPPQPCLKIHAPKHGSASMRQKLGAEVAFRYGQQEIPAATLQHGLVETENGDTRVLIRDREAEAAHLAELGVLGVQPTSRYYSSGNGSRGNGSDVDGELELLRSQLIGVVDTLTTKGWQVEAEGKLFRTAGEFKIEVTSDIDWFDLEATIDFDGVEAKLPELLAAVRKGEKYLELGDGSQGILPEQWLDRYARLADLGTTEDGSVRFKPSQALVLDAMLAEQENLRVDHKFRKFRERLRSFEGVKAKDAPKTFQGTLREYQQEGLGWFQFLQSLGLGGCLADDMGLGKTVQVLALLEQRRTRRLKKGESRRPSLVVMPKSLIFNWIAEAQRFTPKLRVADYTGLDREERVGDLNDYHLIVTTYGTLRRDIANIKEQRFDYAILDESQAIKNANSQSAKACQLLQADHRLALTGTPIENHLGELWSLFEFLNPGMLGRSGAFASLCKAAQPGESDSLGDLARAVAPFMLRRTKQQVLTELPEKTEQTLYCDLLPKDRKAYNELRDFYRDKLNKKIDQKGLKQSKIHVLEALLRLRQSACHVGLVDKKKAGQTSAKLEVLLQQVREVVAEGHKALVFSQFTSLLSIVRGQLDQEGIVYEYLDGRTNNRQERVERFQADAACPLFLISLKAGGSGLNLTAADYVFILDPWWNPAVEAQAIDRTHRIGQTRHVFAYRIIARDTVEEKVLELQKSKRDLANAIITADESLIRNLTAEDLQLILS